MKKMHEKVPWGEFCNTVDPTPRNRVLEFFIEMKDLDYTASDLAKFTKLNRATTYRTIEQLEKENYIMPTRKVSGAQLYKLNNDKHEVKVLLAIFDMILDKIAEEHAPKHPISHKSQRKELIRVR